jgi:hypothetical protein
MFADSVEELDRFALKIGMMTSWRQDKTGFVHYDLNRNMRREAVRAGAVELDRQATADFIRKRRRERG